MSNCQTPLTRVKDEIIMAVSEPCIYEVYLRMAIYSREYQSINDHWANKISLMQAPGESEIE